MSLFASLLRTLRPCPVSLPSCVTCGAGRVTLRITQTTLYYALLTSKGHVTGRGSYAYCQTSDAFLPHLASLLPRPGAAKSAPSTPQTEQRIVPRTLPRHDTFIAPGVSPALTTSPNFRPMKLKTTSFSKTNR
ncbi:hypothetical protein GWK47_047850 [Chionoecetes opilio]|uniref:Uncharacterized protein n=1 Tax=Chionoecetes opilio TaxID=41210 RepID=A0A8J5CUX4_CHIOP|nr:hypothetical protein GWK47_047850 [Chionoecetes opilio]